jgi:ABC-type amino acid transport system permease subunit
MKKVLISLISSIYSLFFGISLALAQELPKPDMSVWNSDKMKPVRDFANIGIGVIFGVAVLYSVIMIAWYGIKLQSAGGDPLKSQDAKNGLKSTVVGVGITFGAIFIIGIILYVLGLIGLKSNG